MKRTTVASGVSLLMAAAGLAACGARPMHNGDPDLYRIELIIDPSAPPYTAAGDFRPRLKRMLELSAAFYGHAPEAYAGLRIVFRGPLFRCGSVDGVRGCNDPDANTITVAEPNPRCFDNVESSALPHEILHYFTGDPTHSAPLWRALNPLWWRIHEGVACTAPESACGQVCAYPWEWNIG